MRKAKVLAPRICCYVILGSPSPAALRTPAVLLTRVRLMSTNKHNPNKTTLNIAPVAAPPMVLGDRPLGEPSPVGLAIHVL